MGEIFYSFIIVAEIRTRRREPRCESTTRCTTQIIRQCRTLNSNRSNDVSAWKVSCDMMIDEPSKRYAPA